MMEKMGKQLAFYQISLLKVEVTQLMGAITISGKTTKGSVLSTSYNWENKEQTLSSPSATVE